MTKKTTPPSPPKAPSEGSLVPNESAIAIVPAPEHPPAHPAEFSKTGELAAESAKHVARNSFEKEWTHHPEGTRLKGKH